MVTEIIAFVVGIIVPLLFTYFLPNAKANEYGKALGAKMSAFGSAKLGKDSYEKLENNITGTFVSFALGFQEGADSDDVVEG